MSKQIDFSKPLSEEDAAYVADRPWLKKDAELSGFDVRDADEFFVDDEQPEEDPEGFEPSENEDDESGEDDGDQGISDEDADEESEDEEDEDGEAVPYAEWEYAELKEEAGNRKLSKAGSKEQLIQRLEESDSAE